MENTLENKAKFFSLYWGQKVMKDKGQYNGPLFYVKPTEYLPELYLYNFLELKPLSLISDEDAIEVARIFNIGHLKGATVSLIKSILRALDGSTPKSETTEFVLHWLTAQDYLRSRGYASPWLGLSVEEQVNIGWIKLKGETK